MSAMVSQTTVVSIVYLTVDWGVDQRKNQRSVSLAFVRGIHWWPVNSPHKGPITCKMLPFCDFTMGLTGDSYQREASKAQIASIGDDQCNLVKHVAKPHIFNYSLLGNTN